MELVEQVTEARLSNDPELPELEHLLERVRALEEGNPMLGTRGVRLGLIHPEIYEMQVRAIFRAVEAVQERTGRAPRVEIMVPLVAYARELELARKLVLRVAAEEGFPHGHGFELGTMIELPRACFARRRDRALRRVLLVRHQRPDADRPRLLARRHRGAGRPALHGPTGSSSARRSRRSTRRASASWCAWRSSAAAPRGRGSSSGSAASTAATRGSIRFFHSRRPRLRQLLAVPRADRARRGRAGRDRGRPRGRIALLGRSKTQPPPPSRAGAAVSYFLILKVT